MIKKIILGLVLVNSLICNAQDKNPVNSNKFLVSIHYTGNLKNENFLSDNYNGILGLDARYVVFNKKSISVQAGLGLDYFLAKEFDKQIDSKNRLMINPNIGLELAVNKTFKPFINLGYSFFTVKYTIQRNYFYVPDYDPAFQNLPADVKFNFNSISINPGFRLYFNQKIYAQADYKYLPIDSNINAHIVELGLGLNF